MLDCLTSVGFSACLLIPVSWITRPLLLVHRRVAPKEVRALLSERCTHLRETPQPGEGLPPEVTHHPNYTRNKGKHLSCQMEERRQISNYPRGSSWFILRRNSRWLMVLGTQEGAYKLRFSLGGGTHTPTASCFLLSSHQMGISASSTKLHISITIF